MRSRPWARLMLLKDSDCVERSEWVISIKKSSTLKGSLLLLFTRLPLRHLPRSEDKLWAFSELRHRRNAICVMYNKVLWAFISNGFSIKTIIDFRDDSERGHDERGEKIYDPHQVINSHVMYVKKRSTKSPRTISHSRLGFCLGERETKVRAKKKGQRSPRSRTLCSLFKDDEG